MFQTFLCIFHLVCTRDSLLFHDIPCFFQSYFNWIDCYFQGLFFAVFDSSLRYLMRLCLVVALCLSAKFDGFIISRGIGDVFVVVPIE